MWFYGFVVLKIKVLQRFLKNKVEDNYDYNENKYLISYYFSEVIMQK